MFFDSKFHSWCRRGGGGGGEWTITLKMADQRWSNIYVVLPRSFAVVTFVFYKLQS